MTQAFTTETLNDLVQSAIGHDDLEDAIASLQGAIGQTQGDVAAAFFSSIENEALWWSTKSETERSEALLDYLRLEALHGPNKIKDRLGHLPEKTQALRLDF